MELLQKAFKRLICTHKNTHIFVRNIYGDEINYRNGARSEWRCPDCGRHIFKGRLNPNE